MSAEDGQITNEQLKNLIRIAKSLAPNEEHRNMWDQALKITATAGAVGAVGFLLLTVMTGGAFGVATGVVMGLIGVASLLASQFFDFDTEKFMYGGKSTFINKTFYELISAFLASSENATGKDYNTAMNIINAAEAYINNDSMLYTEDGTAFIPFQPGTNLTTIIKIIEDHEVGEEDFSYYMLALGLELSRKSKKIAYVQVDGDFSWEDVTDASDVTGFTTGTVLVGTDKKQKTTVAEKVVDVVEHGMLEKLSDKSLISTIVQNGYGWSEYNEMLSERTTSYWSEVVRDNGSTVVDLGENAEPDFKYYLNPLINGDSVKIAEETLNIFGRLIKKDEQSDGVFISIAGDPNEEETNLGKVFKKTINFPSDMANDPGERETLATFEGFVGKKIYSYNFKVLSQFKSALDAPWWVMVGGVKTAVLWSWFEGLQTPAEFMKNLVKVAYVDTLIKLFDDAGDGDLNDTIGEYFEASINNTDYLDVIIAPIIIDKEIIRRVEYFKELLNLTEDGDLTDEELNQAEKEALEAFLSGDFDEEATTLDKSDIEGRRKYFKQCALMLNMPKLHSIYQNKIKEIYKNDIPYHGRFITLQCNSIEQEAMLSSLVSSEKEQDLFELAPHKVTTLMPKIRLYKVFGSGESGKEVEFIFNRHATTDRDAAGASPQTKFMETNFDKGTGVGLKEFSFEFNGTNPAEARNDIKASLTLYFQSFSDFIRYRKSYDDELYRYVDLVIQPTPDKDNKANGIHIKSDRQYEPQFYRIRAEVGYYLPSEKDGFTKDEIEAIRVSNKSFFLNMVDHDISFGKDGTVQISISYRAYLESLLKHPRLDALASPGLIKKREENGAELAKQMQKKECSLTQLKELQISLAAQEELIVKQSLSSIIKRLRKRKVIYNVKINEGSKDFFHKNGYFRKCGLETTNVTEATGDSADIRLVLNTELPENSEDFNFLDTENRNIQFFYFGDLLYTILDCVYAERGIYRVNTGFERSSVILGSFEFEAFQESEYGNTIYNIADIPISVDFFSRWFVDNVVSQKTTRKTFPVMMFIRNLSNHLIKPSLLENCVNRNVESRLRFQTAQVSAWNSGGGNPLLDAYSMEGDKSRNVVALNISDLRAKKTLPLKGGPEVDAESKFQDFHNFIVLSALGSTLTYTGTGKYSEDIKNGRFHINIGQNSGLVKNLSISKSDQQYIREARFFQNGIDGLLQLSAVYKATIEMFGNTMFYPGMEFFFNPFGIGGTELGSPTNRKSVANKLGFGGYHTITSVKSSIGPGKFSTTIVGQQYYSGDGSGNPNLPKKDDSDTRPILIGDYVPENSDNAGAYQNCKNVILEAQSDKFLEDTPSEEVIPTSSTDNGGSISSVEIASNDDVGFEEGDPGVVTVQLIEFDDPPNASTVDVDEPRVVPVETTTEEEKQEKEEETTVEITQEEIDTEEKSVSSYSGQYLMTRKSSETQMIQDIVNGDYVETNKGNTYFLPLLKIVAEGESKYGEPILVPASDDWRIVK